MNIGNRLKIYRNACSLTQGEVADKLGVTRQAISNWERGQSIPDLEMLQKISLLYNIKLEKLLEEDTVDTSSSSKDVPVEKKYLSYFVIIAFLSISCMFPILGIITGIFTFYISHNLNIKSILLTFFTVLTLIISIWNSWSFINANFVQNGTATVDQVAAEE